ncbi:hypothetical protein HDZ31DRAFT_51776, partial [Schizophyllum fasciatum]
MADTPIARTKIRIWQQNMNKSRAAALAQLNTPLHKDWDILCIQEQYMNTLNNILSNSHWRPVFPDRWNANRRPSRTVILVNANIDTNAWRPIIVPDSHDITAI